MQVQDAVTSGYKDVITRYNSPDRSESRILAVTHEYEG
ncbi:hypothetical protein FPSE_11938 [Fusarium pseudograminearum CS3096]|uniref:Uncharacterized protein n=1 Tax=Fusarium pseudograminearum (strain CS3096) TaxID=1028729 RepID=K3V4T1_FUSPC|nr:hypothetical protein FPSE_11938 [Fusarium pseudograminearum CS3096]EKJ67874.1 hypothetical protein FPSE_11938 [Fusarium pseudograminearum CS3096]